MNWWKQLYKVTNNKEHDTPWSCDSVLTIVSIYPHCCVRSYSTISLTTLIFDHLFATRQTSRYIERKHHQDMRDMPRKAQRLWHKITFWRSGLQRISYEYDFFGFRYYTFFSSPNFPDSLSGKTHVEWTLLNYKAVITSISGIHPSQQPTSA